MDKELNIRSNRERTCLRCGCKITPENDSGWEKFTGEVDGCGNQITQPICKVCDAMDDLSLVKAGGVRH